MPDSRAVRIDRGNRDRFRSRQWWTPTRGARLPADDERLLERCRALLLVSPVPAAISERTAAVLWQVPLPQPLDVSALHVTIPAGGFHIERPGVVCHRRDLPEDQVRLLHGVRLTSPERTFVDLGALLSLSRLVAVGDDLLRRDVMSEATLSRVMRGSTKQRGIRRVRQAAELLDRRAESPRESIARVLLWEAGLPLPEPNVDIVDEFGKFIARGDLVYEELKIVLEYDGVHHLSREQQALDADRRLALALQGWLVVTIVPADLRSRPLFIAKVMSAFAERGHPATRPRRRRATRSTTPR